MGIFNFLSNKKPATIEGNKFTHSPFDVVRIKQDAQTRKEAIQEAERGYYPFRTKLQQLYLNTAENGFIKACIDRRRDLTLLRKWEFKDANGNVNDKVKDYFFNTIDGKLIKKQWFTNFITYCLDAEFYGYSLIHLGDIENNSFVNTVIEKRNLVSPDRKLISRFENLITGCEFLEDEAVKDWYVYVDTPSDIGASCCGYGSFFWLSIYENVLRNILRFNSDYIEVNVAPFRQVKTNKTDQKELNQLYEAAINIASNGVMVTDTFDELILHGGNSSGTGYNAYDNYEKRVHAAISMIILGHQDAMQSVPSKLGNSGPKSAEALAMEDKQSRDAEFILPIINNVLFDKMRNLGFDIPIGLTANMLNDNEDVDNANMVISQAKEMYSAGLIMDAKYFTEKTKIPTTVKDMPKGEPLDKNIQNKLRMIYA